MSFLKRHMQVNFTRKEVLILLLSIVFSIFYYDQNMALADADQTPIIIVKGETEVSIQVGESYEDEGVIAYDFQQGFITQYVTVLGSVDTSIPGVYTLIYNVRDKDWNYAETKTRKVRVVGEKSIENDLEILSHVVDFISESDARLIFVTSSPTQAAVGYGLEGDFSNATTPEISFQYSRHVFYLRDIDPKKYYNYLVAVRDERGNTNFVRGFFGSENLVTAPTPPPDTGKGKGANGEVLAIPGAVGGGKNSRGGRGGRVLIVNTREDIVNQNDSFLSLREALTVEKGPRTVVFSVGGVFDMTKKRIELSGANSGYLTVACQTAPDPGVIIKTGRFHMSKISDIVMTHCVHRNSDTGNGSGGARDNGRGIGIGQGVSDVLIDHASISWATDENFQIYQGDYSPTKSIEGITLSNSIISEGDADSTHPQSFSKQNLIYHAMGPSCNSNNSRLQQFNPKKISITSNYIAHNTSRNGAIYSCEAENTNNIIYNWGTIGTDLISWGGTSTVFIRNNLLKAGNSTMQGGEGRCGGKTYRCAYAIGVGGSHPLNIDIRDNYYIGEGKNLGSAQLMSDHPNIRKINSSINFPWAAPEKEKITKLAEENSSYMRCIGASKPSRDSIDQRVITDFYNSTGEVGIFGNKRGNSHNSVIQRDYSMYKTSSHSGDYDRDKDGISDEWERSNGLDPNNPNDYKGDDDKDGYTNIEEFLADMAYCD